VITYTKTTFFLTWLTVVTKDKLEKQKKHGTATELFMESNEVKNVLQKADGFFEFSFVTSSMSFPSNCFWAPQRCLASRIEVLRNGCLAVHIPGR